MARPRVFVSSTYYDLKHVRASLDLFIRSLGFESVLSEKGDVAYAFDRPLDESCYTEVANADLFVLIVGGRYGAAASSQDVDPESSPFFERYDSITRKEYERASELEIPLFVLVEKSVFAEYQTFKLNRDTNIAYAHVDSPNVFLLLEDILTRPRNNPAFTFERFTEIEEWLREQWAGLFRDLLKRQTQQEQMRAFGEQLGEMRAINETLKNYMEEVVTSVAPDRSAKVISDEQRSLTDRRIRNRALHSTIISYLSRSGGEPNAILDAIVLATSRADLMKRLDVILGGEELSEVRHMMDADRDDPGSFLYDLNELREEFGKPRLPVRRSPKSTP